MKTILTLIIFSSFTAHANEAELKERVTTLEKIVATLKEKIEDLEEGEDFYSCRLLSFGKAHTYSAKSKARAITKVLKSCSEASNAVHCREVDVKCVK